MTNFVCANEPHLVKLCKEKHVELSMHEHTCKRISFAVFVWETKMCSISILDQNLLNKHFGLLLFKICLLFICSDNSYSILEEKKELKKTGYV